MRSNHSAILVIALIAVATFAAAAGPVAAGSLEPERLRLRLPVMATAPPGLPTPDASDGIGPGTMIEVTIPNEGTFGCTANAIWKDSAGNLYLGAAGHCFIPSYRQATHGTGADYDASGVTVQACYSACRFGGYASGVGPGLMVHLGEVAYARQEAPDGEQIGWDFGLVRIPADVQHLLRPEFPVWGAADGVTTLSLGDKALVYGNGVGVGETFATKARVGVGHFPGRGVWNAFMPGNSGDSGAGVAEATLTAPDGSVQRVEFVGILTHGLGTLIVGTTSARAQEMALADAGLAIEPVLS